MLLSGIYICLLAGSLPGSLQGSSVYRMDSLNVELDRISTPFGEYIVDERIPDSNVYLLRPPTPESPPLVVKYSADSSLIEQQILRILDETGIGPHIYGVADDSGGVVMEQIAQVVSDLSPAQSVGETLNFGIDLIALIQRLHSAGFVHGDIQPGNIGIRADGSLVLLDFELSRRIALIEDSPYTSLNPLFLSPWQLAGYPAGLRDDLWRAVEIIVNRLTNFAYWDRIQSEFHRSAAEILTREGIHSDTAMTRLERSNPDLFLKLQSDIYWNRALIKSQFLFLWNLDPPIWSETLTPTKLEDLRWVFNGPMMTALLSVESPASPPKYAAVIHWLREGLKLI